MKNKADFMKIGTTLYVTNRKEWRSWLKKHFDKEKEIWLIYYKKHSKKLRIPYNDAVEEALCFGWIDSTVKRIDNGRFAQKFTPRRPKSGLSEMNKERIRRLIKARRMTDSGLKAVSHVFDKEKGEQLKIAPDIIGEIRKNKAAWKNFKKFSDGYKRVRIGYIESQRKPDIKAFQKSLMNFIKMTEKNKKFGMVR